MWFSGFFPCYRRIAFMADENGEKAGWRIKREISIGDIIAFAMAFVSVAYAYATLNARIAVLEDRQVPQNATDKRQDDDVRAAVLDLKATLRELMAKVDRLAERRDGRR
jgi:hypothetical protein